MCVAAAVVGGAATLGSAFIGSQAAGSAAKSQANAAAQANATQQQMYQQTRQDLSGYRGVGGDAASALGAFYGLGGQHPDYQKLLSSMPGYQFQMQSGAKAVDQNLAARGLLQSGAAGKALTQYGQGLGSSYADKYTSGLAGLANMGENAAAGTGAAGSNAANNISGQQIYAGQAAAGGSINQANAWMGGLQGLGQVAGMGYGGYQQQQQQYQANDAQIRGGVNDLYANVGNYFSGLPSIT